MFAKLKSVVTDEDSKRRFISQFFQLAYGTRENAEPWFRLYFFVIIFFFLIVIDRSVDELIGKVKFVLGTSVKHKTASILKELNLYLASAEAAAAGPAPSAESEHGGAEPKPRTKSIRPKATVADYGSIGDWTKQVEEVIAVVKDNSEHTNGVCNVPL